MPNNTELLQAQQPLVQHTMEICLNVSYNSLPSFYNNTVTFLRFAKLYRMLTRCIVFIYTPDTKEMISFARILRYRQLRYEELKILYL